MDEETFYIEPKVVNRTKTSCIVYPAIPYDTVYNEQGSRALLNTTNSFLTRKTDYTKFASRFFKNREAYESEVKKYSIIKDILRSNKRASGIITPFRYPYLVEKIFRGDIKVIIDTDRIKNYNFLDECSIDENNLNEILVTKGHLNLVYVLERSMNSEKKVFLLMMEYFRNLIYGLSRIGNRSILFTPRDVVFNKNNQSFSILNFENLLYIDTYIQAHPQGVDVNSNHFKAFALDSLNKLDLYYFLPPEFILCKLAIRKNKELYELTKREVIETIYDRNDHKSYMSFMKRFEKSTNIYFDQKFWGKVPYNKKPHYIGEFFKQTIKRYEKDLLRLLQRFIRYKYSIAYIFYESAISNKVCMIYNVGMLIAYTLHYGFNKSKRGAERRDFIRFNNHSDKIYEKVFNLLKTMLQVDRFALGGNYNFVNTESHINKIVNKIDEQERKLYTYHRSHHQRVFDFIGRNFNRVKDPINFYIIRGIKRNIVVKGIMLGLIFLFIVMNAKRVGGNILLPILTGKDIEDFKTFFHKLFYGEGTNAGRGTDPNNKQNDKRENPAKKMFFIPLTWHLGKFMLNVINMGRKLGWKIAVNRHLRNPFSVSMILTLITLMVQGQLGTIYWTEEARMNAKQQVAPNTFSPRRNNVNNARNSTRYQPEDFSEFD